MRQLKFRAWDGEQMVSPDYIDRKGMAWWKANSIPTTSEIIMQFTGLQDNNKQDIYEGDIVKIGDWHNAIVVWYGDGWRFRISFTHDIKYHAQLIPQQGKCFSCQTTEKVIIGNIYQHPNLSDEPPSKMV